MSAESVLHEIKPRMTERSPTRLRAFIVKNKQQLADAFVTDISYDGCRIETDEKLKKGERRELRVARRGTAEVEVRWTRGEEAGARFIA